MQRNLLNSLLVLLAIFGSRVGAQAQFNPTLPPDPAAPYTLTLTSVPAEKAVLFGAGTYLYNDEVSVYCTPEEGYAFVAWIKDNVVCATTPEYTFNMPAESFTLMAQLKQLTLRTLTTTASIEGVVECTGGGEYFPGKEITISCTDNIDYTFQYWTRNGEIYSYEQTFTYTTTDVNTEFVAVLSHTPHAIITVQSEDVNKGTVSFAGDTIAVDTIAVGETFYALAIANENYSFSHWTINGSYFTAQPQLYYTVRDNDDVIVAIFKYDPVRPDEPSLELTSTIVLESDPMGAATFNVESGIQYHEGDTLYVQTELSEGYRFVGWFRNDVCFSNTMDFLYVVGRRDEILTLRANPIVYSQLTLTTNLSQGVTFNVQSPAIYEAGSQVNLRAILDQGYSFNGWYLGDSLISTRPDLLYTVPETAVILTAMATYIPLDGEDTGKFDPILPSEPDFNSAYVSLLSDNKIMGSTRGSASYMVGDTITIEAIPHRGYLFERWSDDSTEPVRQLVVTENITLTAYFLPQQYNLTVLSNNLTMGSVSGGGAYDYRSNATIVATPAEGYKFVTWSDYNTDPEHNVYVTGNMTLVATFAPLTYQLTAQSSDPVAGSVTGSGEYAVGSVVEIEAIANEGSLFVKWSDDVVENPRQVVVEGDAEYTALFTPMTYQVNILSADESMGTVSGSDIYPYRANAAAIAKPKRGYQFISWSDGNLEERRNILVTSDTTITATFDHIQHHIHVMTMDTTIGTVTGDSIYNMLDTATITATANYGYAFAQWSDGKTANPRRVVVLEEKTYIALFTPLSYEVTALSDNETMGSVIGTGSYYYNTAAVLVAVPNYGYEFSHWSDGTTDATYNLHVACDTTVTAFFTRAEFTVQAIIADSTMGSIEGTGTYLYGDTATLVAVANYGYEFTGWTDGNTDAERQVVVDRDLIYTPIFAPRAFLVEATVENEAMGSVTGSGNYYYQTYATLVAISNYGYEFSHWSDGSTDAMYDLYVLSDTTLTAYFTPVEFYVTVLSTNESMGYTEGEGYYTYGDTITITAIPHEGFEFDCWMDGSLENPRQVVVAGEQVFVAQFRELLPSALEDVLIDTNAEYYDLQGRKIEDIDNAPMGIYIIRANGTTMTYLKK